MAFDWLAVSLSAWMVVGLYLDGWAHLHVPHLETFFTPWHAVLYSGFLALSGVLLGTFVRNRSRGRPWRGSVPAGYGFSLFGLVLFAGGGIADMAWHAAFGIETGVESILSPPHLVLAIGGTLLVGGPLRAGWRRPRQGSASLVVDMPMLLSLALLLSIFTFFTNYAHPLARPWAVSGNRPLAEFFVLQAADPMLRGPGLRSASMAHALGVAGVILQSALLTGLVLMALARWGWSPPRFSLTVVLTTNAVLMCLMRDQPQLIPGAALAGALGDALLQRLRPSAERATALRLFAFTLPATYYGLYFATLLALNDVWWSLHLWLGSIGLAGIVGWLLSYVAVPPGGGLGHVGYDQPSGRGFLTSNPTPRSERWRT